MPNVSVLAEVLLGADSQEHLVQQPSALANLIFLLSNKVAYVNRVAYTHEFHLNPCRACGCNLNCSDPEYSLKDALVDINTANILDPDFADVTRNNAGFGHHALTSNGVLLCIAI